MIEDASEKRIAEVRHPVSTLYGDNYDGWPRYVRRCIDGRVQIWLAKYADENFSPTKITDKCERDGNTFACVRTIEFESPSAVRPRPESGDGSSPASSNPVAASPSDSDALTGSSAPERVSPSPRQSETPGGGCEPFRTAAAADLSNLKMEHLR